ncbi:MAG: glycosyltransferase family 2 protein, partial [Planctomycetes bacterium]|nr:glycosyltransferase family 2 protein [Planctomycetota bacterium]
MSNRPLPPRLSVVAVVWNARDELEPFLESVLAQVDPATTEIVLVDNGSTDGSREILRERPEVVLIENDRNSGFGAGLNLGCAHATSPRLLLCNPDLEFRPGAIDALVATLDAEPALGGVGPIIRIEGGGVCPLLRGHPGITYGWSFFTGLMAKFPRSRWINAHFDHDPARRSHRQPWLHGCCGLYRRDAFRAIGGFDERFFLYFEDCDLGRRLTEAGWRLALAPDAEVQHREGG